MNYSNTSAEKILNELAKLIRNSYAKTNGATVVVAADPAHAMDLLTAGRPGGATVVLFYASDVPISEEGIEGDTEVEGSVMAAIVQHPGLKLKSGQDAPTVLVNAGKLRSFITSLSIDGVLGGMSYGGMAARKLRRRDPAWVCADLQSRLCL